MKSLKKVLYCALFVAFGLVGCQKSDVGLDELKVENAQEEQVDGKQLKSGSTFVITNFTKITPGIYKVYANWIGYNRGDLHGIVASNTDPNPVISNPGTDWSYIIPGDGSWGIVSVSYTKYVRAFYVPDGKPLSQAVYTPAITIK